MAGLGLFGLTQWPCFRLFRLFRLFGRRPLRLFAGPAAHGFWAPSFEPRLQKYTNCMKKAKRLQVDKQIKRTADCIPGIILQDMWNISVKRRADNCPRTLALDDTCRPVLYMFDTSVN